MNSWKDAVIKVFAVVLFAIIMGWATWSTTTLLSMSNKLTNLDSLKRNWTITARNKERIAEFHSADPNPPKMDER